MSGELSDQVALVTGGGTGIGAAVTACLADVGAVVVVGQPNQGEADDAAERLSVSGRRVFGVGGNLRSASACGKVVEHVVDRFGCIDILVNNAAVTGPLATAPFLDFTDDHLDSVIDVNLKAVFRCSRAAARDMVRRRSGVIVERGIGCGVRCSAQCRRIRCLESRRSWAYQSDGIRASPARSASGRSRPRKYRDAGHDGTRGHETV